MPLPWPLSKVWNWRNEIAFFLDIVQIAKSIGAGVVSLLALLGIVQSKAGPAATQLAILVDIIDAPFPLRFGLLVLIAAAVGWMFGELVRWLSQNASGGSKAACVMISLVAGCLLVLSADWLAAAPTASRLAELEVMSVFGSAVSIWIAAGQLSVPGGHVIGQAVVVERAEALAWFSGGVVAILLLTMASTL